MIRIRTILVLLIGLGLWSQPSLSQDFDCNPSIPPIILPNVTVTDFYSENIGLSFGENISICNESGYDVFMPHVHLGQPEIPTGIFWYPFTYKLIFSKPITKIEFVLLVGGTANPEIDYGAENFVIKSPNCGLVIQDIYSCYTLIEGDTIYLGVDNSGTGWFSVTFDSPVMEFTISGKGGGNGSGFQICSNSIQVAPLWASITAPEQVCAQDSILFTAYEGEPNTNPPPYTFSYTLNGVAQTVTTTGLNDSVRVLTPTTPGTYTYELLSVTDANGNSVNMSCNNTRTVVVEPPPMAQFTASPTSGFAPMEVNLQNQSSNATSYVWFVNPTGGFDSAQPPASTAENPVLTLNDTGSYEITLVAFNDLGCADTTVQAVHVLEELQVVIPNVFTPNNDGINDWFGITSNVEADASIVILNRWGNVVFEKEFVTTPNVFEPLWDGTSAGSVTTPGSGEAVDGVYFYRVKVGDEDPKAIEFSGFVHLKK